MRLTQEQKFLYSRIATLIAIVGLVASAVAGFEGFPFWYGGVALCFWIALGLINFPQKTSVWLAVRKPLMFGLLYITFVGGAVLTDQFALRLHLWFYPFYRGLGFLWVYLVLYPFVGLALLELFYFFIGLFGERLEFVSRKDTVWHTALDVAESLLFLCLAFGSVVGIAGFAISVPVLFAVGTAWIVLAFFKLFFHLRRPAHVLFIAIATFLVAAALHGLPTMVAFEWVYLAAPVLNFMFFSTPLWVWFGYSFLTLFVLRLWIFFVLHPHVK